MESQRITKTDLFMVRPAGLGHSRGNVTLPLYQPRFAC